MFTRRGREPFKPQTVLLRLQRPPRGGSKSGDGQTLSTGVVLGEPGFCLGERGRRDPPAAEARREKVFSPQLRSDSAEELKKLAALSWNQAVGPQRDVVFLDYPDMHLNAYRARGIGEIGIAGVAPAIASAVYHATGVRVRELPIRIENLLGV
jgi:hypothetical protein